MTHKIYTGTLTDAHGREWLPFYWLTAKELEAMTEAGVLPDDIREVTAIIPASKKVITAITSKQTGRGFIKRLTQKVKGLFA